MLGFGFYFVFLHMASGHDYLWPAFLFRVTSVSLVLTALALVRPAVAGVAGAWLVLAAIGFLDTGGNALYAAAAGRGPGSVTSGPAPLQPVVAAPLGRSA